MTTSATSYQRVLDIHEDVIEHGYTKETGQGFNSYAVTNLRGGVGKSSLAFNLAYEMSRHTPLLIADLCPQCNITEILLGGEEVKATVLDAIQPKVLGPAFGEPVEDFSYLVSAYCDSFKLGRLSYLAPGSHEFFAFPSVLYQQLNLAHSQNRKTAVASLLYSLKSSLECEAQQKKCEKILIDTSPFYAGGTHLAWCAVKALIVPVRVDEHSLDSLKLLMDMLSNPDRDFLTWNERAGGLPAPKIAAIVMTMVGSKSQIRATPDRASLMFIERALAIAEQHPNLFGVDDPRDAMVLTDDFHSAGRISGAKRIPISELKVGSFHNVEGKRLQVNKSAERYQKQLLYLASMI